MGEQFCYYSGIQPAAPVVPQRPALPCHGGRLKGDDPCGPFLEIFASDPEGRLVIGRLWITSVVRTSLGSKYVRSPCTWETLYLARFGAVTGRAVCALSRFPSVILEILLRSIVGTTLRLWRGDEGDLPSTEAIGAWTMGLFDSSTNCAVSNASQTSK